MSVSAVTPGRSRPAHPELTQTLSPEDLWEHPRPASLGTQELRLAMAFTGGVSLAVWMGGVAREVDLLVQASERRRTINGAKQDASTPDPDPVRRYYRRLLDLLDVQVCVDVLAGTSAGGINAALLGLANAQRSDLSSLRDTWLSSGSLSQLLRDPREVDPPSLLKGDGQLLMALNRAISAVRGDADPTDEPRATDVFITTTYLSAETSRYADDYGTQIVDSDHHGLFHFNRESLTLKETCPALALAARSSCSFPGAFEPSYIPFGSPGDGASHPDMEGFSNATRPHWAADGGLLVNRPLAPLLQSIFDRSADRQVRRTLLYVVPTSSSPKLPYPARQTTPLSLSDALVCDLEATLNQSIGADLAAIKEHNDRTRSVADTRLRLAGLGRLLPDKVRLADQATWDDYRTRQGDWLVRPLVSELTRQLGIAGKWPAAWEQRAAASRDAAVRALCRQESTLRWPVLLPSAATAADGAATLGQSAFDTAKATVLRLLRLGYILAARAADRAELSVIGTRIYELTDGRSEFDLRTFVRKSLVQSKADGVSVRDAVITLARAYGQQQGDVGVLRAAWTGLATIVGSMQELMQRLIDEEVAKPTDLSGAPAASVLRRRSSAATELSTYLAYLGRGDVVLQLLDLHVVVRSVLPVQLEVEQPVELIQVSADTRSPLAEARATAAAKLTGLQFHHFGAFYKASWRANDWMWGRLDGCGWLVHVLLDPRRILNVMEDDAVPAGQRLATFEQSLFHALDLPKDTVLPAEVRDTLACLDDERVAVPASLPALSHWVAENLQRHIAADELRCVASHMRPGAEGDPSAPARAWLADFDEKNRIPDETARRNAIADLLASCPVPNETLESQRGSSLFLRTATRSVAVATAAGTSLKSPPASLRPTFATLRSITQTAYLATDRTQGSRRVMTFTGLGLMGFGVLAMLTHTLWLGLPGLALFGAGALMLALCIGRTVKKVAQVLLAIAVVLLASAPWLPFLNDHLFSWLEQTFIPWLSREKWVWPVMVLILLIPPATTAIEGLTKTKQKTARRTRHRVGDLPLDPYPVAEQGTGADAKAAAPNRFGSL